MARRELDERYAGGLRIRLLWDDELDRVFLEVLDEDDEPSFPPAMIPREQAMLALKRPLLFVREQRLKTTA